jgi:sulfate adenylyltransferase
MQDHIIKAYGETLVDLLVEANRAEDLNSESKDWISWDLTPRQLCDMELLLCGGFSPLRGFMGREDYESVCTDMRLADGILWPIPITLDVSAEIGKKLEPGARLALRDPEGVMLAVMEVEEIWRPDKTVEAEKVYGTTSLEHAGVRYLVQESQPWYVGGSLEGIRPPEHYDFVDYRQRPAQLRREFQRLGWRKIIAFQTRNPMHRAHFEMTLRAIKDNESNLLIHPVVGATKPGDVDHYTRVRCYLALLKQYPKSMVKLSLLPLAMRMAGPREAIWHALIRRNYGCTHFIVGRDHAGPGSDADGKPFYGPYDAQNLLREHADEIGMKIVPFRMMVYSPERDTFVPIDDMGEEDRYLTLSGTELRSRLSEGRQVPHWFTFEEVTGELRRTYPPRHKQGFTVFFTGLSGAGKSTIARVFLTKLLEMGGRPVSLLDGDIVRKNLSSELGFSKEHRDINIRRIGFVANEISKNGGIAICAPIAPYDSIRKEVRGLIEGHGGFILVHVATPLEVCENRDRKGLYAKARAGIIKEFTGISDPYEPPADADLVIDTTHMTPEESCQDVLLHLEHEGYIGGEGL